MKHFIFLSAFLLLIGFSCKKDKPLPYPSNGLISYFNFDDNLKDQQGYAKDGVGTATFGAGKSGKAAVFNGIDQKIIFSPKTPQAHTEISIAVFIKRPTITTSTVLKISDFHILLQSNETVVYKCNGLPDSPFIITDIISSDWAHIVGTYDGTELKLYINGVLKSTENAPGIIDGFNSDLELAYITGSAYWFKGSIDELYIYNRAITQAEVSQLYNLK